MKRLFYIVFVQIFFLQGCFNTRKEEKPILNNLIDTQLSDAASVASGSAVAIKEVVKEYPNQDQVHKDRVIVEEADTIIQFLGNPNEKDVKQVKERIKKVMEDQKAIEQTYSSLRSDNEKIKRELQETIKNAQNEIKKIQQQREQDRIDAQISRGLSIGALFIVGGGLGIIAGAVIGFSRVYGLIGVGIGIQASAWPYLLDVQWFMPSLAGIVILMIGYVIYGIIKKKKDDNEWEVKYNTTQETLKSTVQAIEEWKTLEQQDKQTLLDTLSKKMDSDEKQLIKEIRKESL